MASLLVCRFFICWCTWFIFGEDLKLRFRVRRTRNADGADLSRVRLSCFLFRPSFFPPPFISCSALHSFYLPHFHLSFPSSSPPPRSPPPSDFLSTCLHLSFFPPFTLPLFPPLFLLPSFSLSVFLVCGLNQAWTHEACSGINQRRLEAL